VANGQAVRFRGVGFDVKGNMQASVSKALDAWELPGTPVFEANWPLRDDDGLSECEARRILWHEYPLDRHDEG
jgi:hypothetical protein